jgi:integrase
MESNGSPWSMPRGICACHVRRSTSSSLWRTPVRPDWTHPSDRNGHLERTPVALAPHPHLIRAFGHAQRWGLLSRKPAALVDPPHVPESETPPLSLDEARSLLEAVAGHRLESLYTVAISHGLRMSEAIGAQWSYIDLDAATFEVWPTLTPIAESEVVECERRTAGAGDSSSATAIERLNVQKHRLTEECRTLGDAWTVNNLVWPS